MEQPTREGGRGLETRRMRGRVAARLFGARMPTTLGRFELGTLLGEGGMGRVYEAFDPLLERRVALKVFKVERMDAAAANALVLEEGRALARLEHPHVVRLYEAGVDEGLAFIAMELIDGPNLHRWAQSLPRRDSPSLLRALQNAADGLAAIHARGLIHGDVKATNILVDATGTARVADLGLAQLAAHATEVSAGTEAYMPPELRDGGTLTPAADCYAFCLSAAELLCAQSAPLDQASRAAWIDDLPRAGVPPRVAAVLTRGLHADLGTRTASMIEVARALRAALGPNSTLRWGLWSVAGGLFFAALASFALGAIEGDASEAATIDVPLTTREAP